MIVISYQGDLGYIVKKIIDDKGLRPFEVDVADFDMIIDKVRSELYYNYNQVSLEFDGQLSMMQDSNKYV